MPGLTRLEKAKALLAAAEAALTAALTDLADGSVSSGHATFLDSYYTLKQRVDTARLLVSMEQAAVDAATAQAEKEARAIIRAGYGR